MKIRRLVPFACLALILGGGSASAASPVRAAPPKPKLVVMISIDQFAAGLFERYRAHFTGGMGRLARGVTFASGYQSHSGTETCPGHSTILTGRHPSGTGIVSNTWYDRAARKDVYCVTVPGVADPAARGPQRLMATTLGDWLRDAQPGARIVSVSGKDRAAIMLGGHKADAVYWWSDGDGFVTSSYAGPADASVTAPAVAFDRALFARWTKSPPMLWPARPSAFCAPNVAPHRFGDVDVSGTEPPAASIGVAAAPGYLATKPFQDQLRVSPTYDALTLDFATKLLEQRRLGKGKATDLLAISLSATDYIGHRYGNGGAEMCAQMESLDAALGKFLKRLDALHVPVVVALTGDHGAMDAVERAREHGIADARRIDGAALIAALNDHLKRQFALDYAPVPTVDPQEIVIQVPGGDRALWTKLRDAAVVWLKAQDGVAQVFTADAVAATIVPPGKAPDQLSVIERMRESYYAGRSADIMVAYRPHLYPGVPHKPNDAVAGHGSPWDYDRRVPILFWWPRVKPDDRATRIETVDIAPTLARIAGIPAPPVDGRCIDLATPDSATCPASPPPR